MLGGREDYSRHVVTPKSQLDHPSTRTPPPPFSGRELIELLRRDVLLTVTGMRRVTAVDASRRTAVGASTRIAIPVTVADIRPASYHTAISTVAIIQFFLLSFELLPDIFRQRHTDIFERDVLAAAAWRIQALVSHGPIEQACKALVTVVVLTGDLADVVRVELVSTAQTVKQHDILVSGISDFSTSFFGLGPSSSRGRRLSKVCLFAFVLPDRTVLPELRLVGLARRLTVRFSGVSREALDVLQLKLDHQVGRLLVDLIQHPSPVCLIRHVRGRAMRVAESSNRKRLLMYNFRYLYDRWSGAASRNVSRMRELGSLGFCCLFTVPLTDDTIRCIHGCVPLLSGKLVEGEGLVQCPERYLPTWRPRRVRVSSYSCG